MCTAEITFDVILEGSDSVVNCVYEVRLLDPDGNTIPGAIVGRDQVGQLLRAKIFEMGRPNGPSCWTYIRVEDKLPPPLECAGNDTLMCWRADPYATDMDAEQQLASIIQDRVNVIDNCGDEEIEVIVTNNVLDGNFCMDGFSAIRYLAYDVLDNNRNFLECEDTIYYESLPLDSIDAPKDYIDDMALDCNDPYPTVEYLLSIDREAPGQNSLPNIDGTSLFDRIDSLFEERGLCNIQLTTDDLVFPTCGNTFKIVRRHFLLDWCTRQDTLLHQIIKVEDTEISLQSCGNITGQTADPATCTSRVTLADPVVAANECSDWRYTILVKEPGGTSFIQFGGERSMTTPAGQRDFALGTSMVQYAVMDACGNVDTCMFTVEVVDEEPPIAVCDGSTIITLTDRFLGKVFARSFDDGSYDGCSGIASYKVRRVDRASTICDTPTDYDDFVKFCCADVGKTIFVEFQVTDSTGLTSECIASATVQFKGDGPQVTCATPVGIQDCRNYETFDINSLMTPTISSVNPCIADNLSPTIREVARDIDECGDGFIDVAWSINLTGEDEVICTERISFENQMPFSESMIMWPADRMVNTCGAVPPTMMELDNLLPDSLICTQVQVSEPMDRVIENVSGVCRRVLRTWTVVDWCRFPEDPNARFTYVQTIDILNTSGPAINTQASAVNLTSDQANCQAIVSATGVATDDCVDIMAIDWTYTIVSDPDQEEVIAETNGGFFSLPLSIGAYQLIWRATDDCGNTSEFIQSFEISDITGPTMRCRSFEREIDPLTQDVFVTTGDVDNGTFDNCDPVVNLLMRRADTDDPLTETLIFDCQERGITSIEIVGTDTNGNMSTCLAVINVLDTDNACNISSSSLDISGQIHTVDGVAIESASVFLDPLASGMASMTDLTDVQGEYVFANVMAEHEYEMTARKEDNYLNGVTALDIILMQQHILGLKPIQDIGSLLAADVDDNARISATDIVMVRRLLLGDITSFPKRPSWIFVDARQLADPKVDRENIAQYVVQSTHDASANLVGIKMGDIDQNAIANSALSKARSVASYGLLVSPSKRKNIRRFELIASEDVRLKGMQLGIEFDPSTMSFKGITSNTIDISDEQIRVLKNQVRIVWTTDQFRKLQAGEILFDVQFESIGDEHEGDLRLSTSFVSEMYDSDLRTEVIHLVKVQAETSQLQLYQNRPNPFEDHTVIEFELPEEGLIEFAVFDINGAQVFDISQVFVAGQNQIRISKEGLGLNKGIYYYQISDRKRSLIKKMIIL